MRFWTRRKLRIALVAALLVSGLDEWRNTAVASGGPWGLGIILGEPTGFTAKHWISSRAAADIGMAFSFNSFFLLYGDYLWHFPRAFSGDRFVQQLTPYIGVGGEAFFSTASGRNDPKYFTTSGSSVGFGLRIPVGLEWRPSDPPLGVFVELVPGIGIVPSTFGFVQGGIGIRWFF